MANKRNFSKNAPNWKPSKDNYLLIFQEVDGYWKEISGNIQEYADMVFADYLDEIDIHLPDDCTFCRVSRDDWTWEFRAYGAQIRINYYRRKE